MSIYYIKKIHCQGCVNKIKTNLPESVKCIAFSEYIGRFEVDTDLTYEELKKIIDSIVPNHYSLQKHIPIDYIISKYFKTYKPIILGFMFVIIGSFVLTRLYGTSYMGNFMGLFFLLFGLMKFRSIKGFASMYREYDIIARTIPFYGYVYPFLEILAGVLYFIYPHSLILNSVVLLIMSMKSIGVYKALKSGAKLTCACLGTGFSVPISWLTFAEDFLMAGMALWMII